MGRSRINPTPADIAKIELLAGRGFRLDDIAIALGISVSTLQKWKNTPAIADAYQRGRIEAISSVAGKLYDLAMAGDVTACIFYLKAQGKWIDKPQPEAPATPEIQIYLPQNNR